ncbi:MAG: NAD-dependent epimerase/dehydratase family protein [Spirochaetales bacterium]|nr:NAD-dependent epimerase/dehydratase family protein [Spirochaetales bacterium]
MGAIRKILVTGSDGFLGKNLVTALEREKNLELLKYDLPGNESLLARHVGDADFIYHLAGVNRPENTEDFEKGNAGLTEKITGLLRELGRKTPLVLSSSTQAGLDNDYGRSKSKAEDIVEDYGKKSGAPVFIFRLTNVFGKWSRPNYNSAVATFCHNVSHGLEIWVSDENKEVELVYIDDVVRAFTGLLNGKPGKTGRYYSVAPAFTVSLGSLVGKIRECHEIRNSLLVPDFSDYFMKCLYATYLSFLEPSSFSYPVRLKSDERGNLFELLKSRQFGQIFVSRTVSGAVRGHHFHDTKVEKFCLIQGKGLIRFKHVITGETFECPVSGDDIRVVDIPPGYTHSIENTGEEEMIVLFWASEIFNPENTDTYPLKTV